MKNRSLDTKITGVDEIDKGVISKENLKTIISNMDNGDIYSEGNKEILQISKSRDHVIYGKMIETMKEILEPITYKLFYSDLDDRIKVKFIMKEDKKDE